MIGHPPSKKLVVLGLDGLNWTLLDPLLERGVMPHLARLRDEGAWGTLTSVVPTLSATAWASFITGQGPARHGVLDFMVRQPDGTYRHSKPPPSTTLWHLAGTGGLRVGVLNFPVTYPPDPVNGFLVSGMLSPKGKTFTYPPELGDDLLAAVPGYRLDLEWQLYRGREGALLQDLIDMTRERTSAASYLQERYAPDLFAVALVGTDRLQHALWRHLDPTHPRHDRAEAAERMGEIQRFYATVDRAVGEVIDGAGAGAAALVLSDHGFQPAAWQFRVDDWLASRGWLTFRSRSRFERLVRRLDTPWVRHVRRQLVTDVSRHFSTFSPGGTIDWSRTVAFCPWNEQQGIRLNVRGREREGIVGEGKTYKRLREEILAALVEVVDPRGSQRVVAHAWRREEVYDGPFLAEMPDLVFALNPPFSASPVQTELWAPTGWASGDHSLEGIFIARGEGLARGEVAAAHLTDMAPTALYLMGQPAAVAMDGRVAVQAFDPAWLEAHPVQRVERPAEAQDAVLDVLTAEEQAEVQARLRGLGYL